MHSGCSISTTTTTTTTASPDSSHATAIEIRKLIDTIGFMGESEHEQLLKILNTHGCRHTENSNGVFINLAHAPPECVYQMQQFARFWKDKNQHIHLSEQARMELQQALGGETTGNATPASSSTRNLAKNNETSPAVVVHRSATVDPATHAVGGGGHGCGDPEIITRGSRHADTETAQVQNSTLSAPKTGKDVADVCPPAPRKGRKPVSGSMMLSPSASNTSEPHTIRDHDQQQQQQEGEETDGPNATSPLSPEEESLIRAPVANKRRHLSLNKGGKQLLKRGGATSRVARTCIASEDNQLHEAHSSTSHASDCSGFGGGE
jgi:hypothetical protein